MSELEVLLDLLGHEGFLTGLIAGLVMFGVLVTASLSPGGRVSGWAFGLSIVTVAILQIRDPADAVEMFALGSVVVASISLEVASRVRRRTLRFAFQALSVLLLVIGVIWLGNSVYEPGEAWVSFALPLVILAIGASLYSFARVEVGSLLAPMVAMTVFAVWLTIPETDAISVAVGGSLALVGATLPPVKSKTTMAGAFALASILVWLTVAGGESRPSSIVGGWTSIGLIPLIPILAVFGARPPGILVVLMLHFGHLVVVTRTVDIWDSSALVVVPIAISYVLFGLTLVLWPSLKQFVRARSG